MSIYTDMRQIQGLTCAKRVRTLDVPIAITAFNSEKLQERNVISVMDVGDYVPNVKFDTDTDPTSARIYIRGLGPGPGPRVGLYIDGIYWGRRRGSVFSLMDIESIEVLRGPQGVTFGRNTTGGAVLVRSNKPSADLGGHAKVGYGDRNLFTTEGVFNYPIRENLFTRVAFQSRNSDGYIKNVLDGNTYWDENNQSIRASLRYLPTEDVDILLTARRRRQREHGPLFTCAWTGDLDPRFPTSEFHELMLQDGILDDYRAACQRSRELAPRRGESQVRNSWDLDSWGTDGRIEWDLGRARFRSLTAWRRVEWEGGGDADSTGFVLSDTVPGDVYKVRIDALTQELNLEGSLFGDRVEWLLGAYWLDERISRVFPAHQPFAFSPIALTHVGGENQPIEGGTPDHEWEEENRSLSFFGEATYHVSDRLALSAGVRRIHERKQLKDPSFCFPESVLWSNAVLISGEFVDGEFRGVGEYFNAVDCIGARNWSAERYDGWTPRFSASYRLSDRLMVYGSWSRGFATGDARSPRSCSRALRVERVLGTLPQDLCADAPDFEPEEVVVWEAGFKSDWFDNRLRVNLNYYHTKFDGIQVVEAGARHGMLSLVSYNAGKATIQGLELEVIGRPLPGLTVDFGLGTIDAEYDEFTRIDPDPSVPDNPVSPDDFFGPLFPRDEESLIEDRTGLNFDHTPNVEFNIGAQYDLPVRQLGDLTLRADWNHRGRVHNARNNLSAYEQGKRGVLSGRLTLRFADGKTEVALWGRNLLDREYLLAGASDFDGAFGSEAIQFAAPRRFGIELTRRFGS